MSQNTKYKTLEKEFKITDFTLKQIERKGNVAIFEKTNVKLKYKTFEVIIIKTFESFERWGKFNEAGESYPSNSEFGRLGWDCATKERAYEKFYEILKLESSKIKNKK